MPESPNFREFDVLDFPGIASNGFVEVDNLGVRVGKGSEKLKNIFGVLLQLIGSVGECTEDGCRSGVPCDGPISVGLDDLGWFTTTDGEVEISNGGGGFVIGKGGEESGENGVKIDRCSRKDVLPLRFWEWWEGSSGLQRPDGMLKVGRVILDHDPRTLEIR